MDLTTAEDAIHAWLVAATGLAADRVVWAHQPGTTRPSPSLTMRVLSLTGVGADGVTHTFDPLAGPGEEITFTSEGRRVLAVSVQAYSDAVSGSGTAHDYLSRAQAALALPTTRDALRAAGLGAFNPGAITDLSAIRETRFQSRAAMTVQFHCVDSATGRTTYIETAEVTREVTTP